MNLEQIMRINNFLVSCLALRLDHLLFVVLLITVFLFHNNLGFDYFWHIKAGEYLSQHGEIPATDIFSFTFAGKPWVLHEWLFQWCLYHIYDAGGHYAVKLFSASLLSLSLFIVYRATSALGGSKAVSVVLAVVSFTVLIQFALPRPQLLTYVFVSLYLYLLLGYKYRRYPVSLYWLPVLMVAWVNLHGGYVIGIVLLLLFLVAEWLGQIFAVGTKDEESLPLRPLVRVLLLCILASALNPYTVQHWLYPFQVIGMSANNIILEWKSPSFHTFLNKIYLIYLLGFFFLRSYSVRRPELSETVLPFFFIMMGFVAFRHVPIALLVVLPFYAMSVRDFALSWPEGGVVSRLVNRIRCWRERIESGPQMGSREYKFNWMILLVIIVLTFARYATLDTVLSADDNNAVPRDAVTFIQEEGIQGNVLNTYHYGGYLIYRLYPQSRVFIDGRADLYGDKFMDEFQTIYKAREGWREAFDRYPVDYVLCDNSAPILWHLRASGEFVLVYRDAVNSVLVRKGEKYGGVIEKYADQYNDEPTGSDHSTEQM